MAKTWPCVLPNDNGIRPVLAYAFQSLTGKPDRCFYCDQQVGQPHKYECVVIVKEVEYEVIVNKKVVGTFTRNDPYSWSEDDCNFHKNGSSWCSDNAIGEIVWNDTPEAKAAQERIEKYTKEDSPGCTCNWLTFEFSKVTEEGPIRSQD